MFLRRSYICVYLIADGKAIDTHKHYIEAAGHSEHAWFIEQLAKDPGGLNAIARGPKPSRGPRKLNKGGRRSEDLQAILKAPSQRGPIDDPIYPFSARTKDSLMV